MEKRKPTYDLESIKDEFSSVDTLRMTRTAQNDALALGFILQDVVDTIQAITRKHFVKSMTSYADYTCWQDVYSVPREGEILYVKFTTDDEGKLLISFKRQ